MTTSKSKRIQTIKTKLSRFVVDIELDNKRNLTDINIEAEDLFCSLLNILWGTNLKNPNKENPYTAGVDLYDKNINLLVQISSDGSKKKIESSLQTCANKYPECNFRFICLKGKLSLHSTILVPRKIKFNQKQDIYDLSKLLKEIDNSAEKTLEEIYNFIKEELYPEDLGKLTSDLGHVVHALATDPQIDMTRPSLITPELKDKIDLNDLTDMQDEIEEWSSFSGFLDQVYNQYSASYRAVVQSRVTRSYYQCKEKEEKGISLFYAICGDLLDFITSHNDLSDLSDERIEYCLNIVITDVFMRCRIFEKSRKLEDNNDSTR